MAWEEKRKNNNNVKSARRALRVEHKLLSVVFMFVSVFFSFSKGLECSLSPS